MNKHEDERGIIEDLKIGRNWAATYVSFKKGAVRGNHYHKDTEQKDYVVSGELECYQPQKMQVLFAGDGISHPKNTPHAYRARTDAELITIVVGKRIGEDYEKDTFRLETPLI